MPYLLVSSMNIGAGIFLSRVLSIWCFFLAISIYNHTCRRKGEQSFAYNGLKNYAYYMTHYIRFYILHGINSAFFVASGLVLEFFSRTSPPVLYLLFLIWGHLQIALAFLFSV